jgi:hypothetical protein
MPGNDDSALLLALLNQIRNELRDQRALLLESIDHGRSLERHLDYQLLALNQRLTETKDELELTFRTELMGLIGSADSGGRGRQ